MPVAGEHLEVLSEHRKSESQLSPPGSPQRTRAMSGVTAGTLNSIDWPMNSASPTGHLAWNRENVEIFLCLRPGSVTQVCHRMTTVL